MSMTAGMDMPEATPIIVATDGGLNVEAANTTMSTTGKAGATTTSKTGASTTAKSSGKASSTGASTTKGSGNSSATNTSTGAPLKVTGNAAPPQLLSQAGGLVTVAGLGAMFAVFM